MCVLVVTQTGEEANLLQSSLLVHPSVEVTLPSLQILETHLGASSRQSVLSTQIVPSVPAPTPTQFPIAVVPPAAVSRTADETQTGVCVNLSQLKSSTQAPQLPLVQTGAVAGHSTSTEQPVVDPAATHCPTGALVEQIG